MGRAKVLERRERDREREIQRSRARERERFMSEEDGQRRRIEAEEDDRVARRALLVRFFVKRDVKSLIEKK